MPDTIASDCPHVNHLPSTQHKKANTSFGDCQNPSCIAQWIQSRVTLAKQSCLEQGTRFTPLREQVYRLILQAKQPLGAYDLLAQLQINAEKPVAPPTVYRSLDFLLQQGLIHQLSSTKAFFACCQPDGQHTAAFLICQQCGEVNEFNHEVVQGLLKQMATQSKFTVQSSVIELSGRCRHCQQVA